jgi:hypothetical protein
MSALPPWPWRQQKVWVQEVDPDLTDNDLARRVQAAADAVTGRWRRVPGGGTETVVAPVGKYALRAVVYCIGRDCHQAGLACVWRTEHGLLYWARLVFPHDHNPPPPFVPIVHPDLPGQVTEVAVSALDQHGRSGWVPAPPGTSRPARTYRQPAYAVDVRDLLDVDSSAHPPLRAKCPRHKEVMLDRDRLRGELARGHNARGTYRIPLSAVVVL